MRTLGTVLAAIRDLQKQYQAKPSADMLAGIKTNVDLGKRVLDEAQKIAEEIGEEYNEKLLRLATELEKASS